MQSNLCRVMSVHKTPDDFELSRRRVPRRPKCTSQLLFPSSDIHSATALHRMQAGVFRAFGRRLPTRCGIIAPDHMHVVSNEGHTDRQHMYLSNVWRERPCITEYRITSKAHNRAVSQNEIDDITSRRSSLSFCFETDKRCKIGSPFLDRG